MDYTKGKWKAYKDKYVKGVTVTSPEGEICICDYKDGKGYANARLIAAAPDLYEAIKAAVTEIEDGSANHAHLILCDAIAKVETDQLAGAGSQHTEPSIRNEHQE